MSDPRLHSEDVFLTGLLRFVLVRGRLLAPAEPGLGAALTEALLISRNPGWRGWDHARLAEILAGPPDRGSAAEALAIVEGGDYEEAPIEVVRGICAAAHSEDDSRWRALAAGAVRLEPGLRLEAVQPYAERLGRLTAAGVYLTALDEDAVPALATMVEPVLRSFGVPERACGTCRRALSGDTASMEAAGLVRTELTALRTALQRLDGERELGEVIAAITASIPDRPLLQVVLLRGDLCRKLFRGAARHYRDAALRSLLGTAFEGAASGTSWLDRRGEDLLERAAEDTRWGSNLQRLVEALLQPPGRPEALALLVVDEGGRRVGRVVRLGIGPGERQAAALQLGWKGTTLDRAAMNSCENACRWLTSFLPSELPRIWEGLQESREMEIQPQLDLPGHAIEGGSLGLALAVAALAQITGREVGVRQPGDVAMTGAVEDARGAVGRVAGETLRPKLEAIRLWNEDRLASDRIRYVLVPREQEREAQAILSTWPDGMRPRVIPASTVLEAVAQVLVDPWGEACALWQQRWENDIDPWLASLERTVPPSAFGRSLRTALVGCATVPRVGAADRIVAASPAWWEPTTADALEKSAIGQLAEAVGGAIVRQAVPDTAASRLQETLLPLVVPATARGSPVDISRAALERLGLTGVPAGRIEIGLQRGRFAFVIYGVTLGSEGFFAPEGPYAIIAERYPGNVVIVVVSDGAWKRRPGGRWETIRLTPTRSTVADLHLARMTGDLDPLLLPEVGEAASPEAMNRVLACRRGARTADGRLVRPSPREFFAGQGAVRHLPLALHPCPGGRPDRSRSVSLIDALQEQPVARLLLLGPSGAGKTVEILFAFYQILAGRLDPEWVPLFLPAEDLLVTAPGGVRLRNLDEALAVRLAGAGLTEEEVRRRLGRTSGLVLLLDGLSEALARLTPWSGTEEERGAARSDLLRRLEQLRRGPLTGAACVITARRPLEGEFDFVREPPLRDAFAVYEMAELTGSESRQRALDYLSAAADPAWYPGRVHPGAVERLLAALEPRQTTVLEQPIMIYLLSTILHKLAAETVSLDLSAIWEEALDAWLEDDYRDRQTGAAGTIFLEPAAYHGLLHLLALEMHRRAVTSLEREEVVNLLDGYLRRELVERRADLPAWWPRVQGDQGLRPLGARRRNGKYTTDRLEIERLVATLAQSTLLRAE